MILSKKLRVGRMNGCKFINVVLPRGEAKEEGIDFGDVVQVSISITKVL